VIVKTEPTVDEEQAETPTYEASEVVVKESCDPDANWVKKGKVCTYGYKAHTMTDSNGIVVCMEVTSANVHDTVMFPDLIDKAQLRPLHNFRQSTSQNGLVAVIHIFPGNFRHQP